METGQRGATLRDVRDLCELYGVTDQAQVEHLMDLVREGKQQAWWQSHELDYFATYVGLEAGRHHSQLLPVHDHPWAFADGGVCAGDV